MTHIDPFAPGDSPQHPANWGKAPTIEDALADLYQWQRDHLTMASEANADVAPEVLKDRHARHGEYLDRYGDPYEQQLDSEFVSMPALLRREAYADLDDDEVEEWNELFARHATDEERDPLWVEGSLPDLVELRARADADAAAAALVENDTEAQDAAAEELPPAPRSTALKEEWVEFALAVDKVRGGTLTPEQANAMSIADLKAAYKPQASR